MSLPPLKPDKTTSGIIQDPKTLERVVPSSQRKDGTVRKELKIRPGFTPQEDVGRFRSARQQVTDTTKNVVPGSAGRSSGKKDPYDKENPFKQDPAEQTKTAQKNARRREKKRETETGGGSGEGANGKSKLYDTSLAWDEDVPGENPDADEGTMKEMFEEMDRLRLEKKAAAGQSEGVVGTDESNPLGTGSQQVGGGAPDESIAAAVASDSTPWADQEDSPAEKALSPPPPADDVPETAAQTAPPAGPPARTGDGLADQVVQKNEAKPSQGSKGASEGEWRQAGSKTRGSARGGGGGSGRGGGRGGNSSRGGPVGSAGSRQNRIPGTAGQDKPGSNPRTPRGTSTPNPAPASKAQAPPAAAEPRVRKEVRVREGAAGDLSSLASRVRGLVIASQDGGGRERRNTAKAGEGTVTGTTADT